jgi:hypothetical protein
MLGRAIEMALGGRSMLRDPQHAQDAGGEDVEGSGREGMVLNVCVWGHVLYLSGGGGGVLRGKWQKAAYLSGAGFAYLPIDVRPVLPTHKQQAIEARSF